MRFNKLARDFAVEVLSVNVKGPAKEAGIKVGDFIVALNGQAVASVDDLHRFLSEGPFDQHLSLTVIRGREKLDLAVAMTEARVPG